VKPILAIMYREYLIRKTSPLWLFFDLVVPLLYLLMFGVGLDRAIGMGLVIDGKPVLYNEFFLAGVLSMSCFGSAINHSYGFFIDRDNGIFYEFLTYPMTRGQLLIGKIVFGCLMTIVQGSMTIAAAVWILDVNLQWQFLLVVLAGLVVGIAGWFFSLAILAFRVRRNDTFNTVLNVTYFVLMFVSSMFYPLDSVPSWLATMAMFNPLSWHTDVLRFFTVGIGDFSVVVSEMIGFSCFLIISFWFAVRSLQRAE